MPSVLGYTNDDLDFYLFNGTVDTNPAGRGYDATVVRTIPLSRRVQAGTAEIGRAYLTDQNWGGAARSDIRIQQVWRVDCPGTNHGIGDLLLVYDIVGGRPLFRISRQEQTTNNNYGLWYNSSSTATPVWVLVGGTAPVPNAALHTSTVTIKMADSGGLLQWHVNGALMAQLSGDTLFTPSTTFDCIQWWTPGQGGSGWGTHVDAAEIIMASADYMTYGLRVVSGQLVAAGAYQQQLSGVVTDLNDLVLNTGNGITFDTIGQRATFTFSDLPAAIAAAPVMGVRVAANARIGASGPSQVKLLVNQAGGLASSAALPLGGIGFSTVAAQFPTDVAGNAWTAANYNAAEAGLEAA